MYNKKAANAINAKFEEEFSKLDSISKKMDRYYTNSGITLGSLVSMVKSLMKENETLREQVSHLVNMNDGTVGEADGCELFLYKSYRNGIIIYKDGKPVDVSQAKTISIEIDSKNSPVSINFGR